MPAPFGTETPPSLPRPSPPTQGQTGYRTPLQPQSFEFRGLMQDPVGLQSRPAQQQSVLAAQIVAIRDQNVARMNSSRREPFRPMVMRHGLPISSGAVTGAQPATSFSFEVQPAARTALGDAVNLISLRNQMRNHLDHQQPSPFFPTPQPPQQASPTVGSTMTPAPSPSHAPTPPVPIPEPVFEPPTHYEGSGEQCSICVQEYAHDERVCRLHCRHIFHCDCYEEYLRANPGRMECPNCRGQGHVMATWSYIGDEDERRGEVEAPYLRT